MTNLLIALAPNLFFGTSIAVNILVLSKHKSDTKTQFIDASGTDYFKKETNNNILTPEHIDAILELFACSTDNISLHLKNIFNEGELDEISTTEEISVVQ